MSSTRVHPGPLWAAVNEPTGAVTVWLYRKPNKARRTAEAAFPGRTLQFRMSLRSL
jgi:hypothetical protein